MSMLKSNGEDLSDLADLHEARNNQRHDRGTLRAVCETIFRAMRGGPDAPQGMFRIEVPQDAP